MGWEIYRLVYQAKSPIHIGWYTLGYIRLTRCYITGTNMWGAMTANLTRAFYEYSDYSEVGMRLCSDILISYFYPALDSNNPLLPEFTDTGLFYGPYTATKFEKLFIRSYGQTAVIPESNTAEDESLHESEFISPVVEDEETHKQSQVNFVGYIFIKDGLMTKNQRTIGWESKEINLQQALSEIFVGGDRRYGWGRLVLSNEKTKKVTDTRFFNNHFIANEYELKVEINENQPIPAHLLIDNRVKIKGDIEYLVGRQWDITGPGQSIEKYNDKPYWIPGSILQESGKKLIICPYGTLSIGG